MFSPVSCDRSKRYGGVGALSLMSIYVSGCMRKICGWRLLNDNDLKFRGMGPLDSSMIPWSMNLVLPINQR